MDEAEKDEIELVAAGTDPAEALEPAEKAFDLVAAAIEFSVVGPGRVAIAGRRHNGAVAEVPGELARLVAVIGAIHDQRGPARDRSEPAQQLSTSGRIATLSHRRTAVNRP